MRRCPCCKRTIPIGFWSHVQKCYQKFIRENPHIFGSRLLPEGKTLHTVPDAALERMLRDGN
jgi:hypothetical protein